MVKIEIEYTGSLRCSALHTPSQTRLITDAPVDNHGKGESFSPTDLVATALGTCMATLMGIFAERHAIDLAGMKITVVKEMTTKPPRRIGRLATGDQGAVRTAMAKALAPAAVSSSRRR